MDNSNIETEDMADLESSWDLESVAREKVGLGGPDVSDIVGEAIDPSLCHQPPSGGFNIVWSVISSIFGMTTHLKETHASKPERENNGAKMTVAKTSVTKMSRAKLSVEKAL